ncbi:copper transporter [Capillibacterium thermochitinicola]|uniref:Copper transporter n=1 Tax=Capillibacterium thermochitinicola TaxID=2699427 RepID=A0A8J6I183_9FIRM|nr:copper transporter [Capillibacterium thermochitinicola]MBA2133800.1 copper transporter [Capillibacterium thermochitinicola]
MPLDFRYYISSLAAIFLALGIGIVIGGALMNNDAMGRRQEQLILNLEREFDQLRAEKKALQAGLADREVELEVLRQFNREVLPLMVNGLLTDRSIGIVKTNHTVPNTLKEDLITILELAGAQVRRHIDFSLWPPSPTAHQALAAHLGVREDDSWFNQVLSAFITEVVLGQEGAVLTSLQANSLIQLNQVAAGPVDTLILLGGSYEEKADRVDQLDLVLAKAAKEKGVTVVGVEPLAALKSYISRYKNAGLVTIDNIDTLPGQVALVLALAAGENGHYGVKNTARSLLPKTFLTRSARNGEGR